MTDSSRGDIDNSIPAYDMKVNTIKAGEQESTIDIGIEYFKPMDVSMGTAYDQMHVQVNNKAFEKLFPDTLVAL